MKRPARVSSSTPTRPSQGIMAIDFYVPSFEGKYVAAAISKADRRRRGSSLRSRDRQASPTSFRACTSPPAAAASRGMRTAPASITRAIRRATSERRRKPTSTSRCIFTNSGTPSRARRLHPRQRVSPHRRDPACMPATTAAGCSRRWPTGWRRVRALPHGAAEALDASHRISTMASSPSSSAADGALYLLSRKDAPRGKILRLPLAHLDLDEAKVMVPKRREAEEADRASIENFVRHDERLYVIDIVGGRRGCGSLTIGESACRRRPAAGLGHRSGGARVGGGGVAFLRIHVSRAPGLVPLSTPPTASSRPRSRRRRRRSTSATPRSCANSPTSKDGTTVPLNIIRRKGTQARRHTIRRCSTATAATASAMRRLLDLRAASGSTGAASTSIANLRGGGEYGEEWHHAGQPDEASRTCSTTFAACAQYLIEPELHDAARSSPSWAAATAAC